jgi:hypothetical protein
MKNFILALLLFSFTAISAQDLSLNDYYILVKTHPITENVTYEPNEYLKINNSLYLAPAIGPKEINILTTLHFNNTKSKCIGKGEAKLYFVFEDGSKIAFINFNDFNCNGIANYSINLRDRKIFSEKSIKTIYYKSTNGEVLYDFVDSEKDYLKLIIGDHMKGIFYEEIIE